MRPASYVVEVDLQRGHAEPVAKGKEKHQARQEAIQLLGKDLARRARSKCELCESSDDLRAWDTAPDAEPTLETLLLACERCRALFEGRVDDPKTLRFLETAIWSNVPPVAQSAREAIKRVDSDWARHALELIRTSRPSRPPA